MFPESTRDHRLFLFREEIVKRFVQQFIFKEIVKSLVQQFIFKEIVKRLVQQFIFKETVRRLQFNSSFPRRLLKGQFSSSFSMRLLEGYSLVVHFQGDFQKVIVQYFIFKEIVRRLQFSSSFSRRLLEGYSFVVHFLFVQVWIHCLCNTSRAATQQCYILYYTSIYSLQW